jgi:F-type H+-transporting ATPase subunit epsilon
MMPDGRFFNFSIVTPEKILVEGRAEFLSLPGLEGEFGILYNRSPLLVRLQPGIVRVKTEGREDWYFVAGGFGDVINNQVTILTPRALNAEEVRAEDAQAARTQAGKATGVDPAGQRKQSDAHAEAHALDRVLAKVGQ